MKKIIIFIIVIICIISATIGVRIFLFNDITLTKIYEVTKIDIKDMKNVALYSNTYDHTDSEFGNEDYFLENSNVLFFIDDQGNWDAYETYGLVSANVEWTEDGIYFGDTVYNYFIDNEGNVSKTKLDNPDTIIYSEEGIEVADDGTVYRYSNIGSTEWSDGYLFNITKQYKGKSESFFVEGAYAHIFTVNNDLYAITSAIEFETDINPSIGLHGLVKFDEQMNPQILNHEKTLNDEWIGYMYSSDTVVQHNNKIYFLEPMVLDNNDMSNIYIHIWDTKTIEYETKFLKEIKSDNEYGTQLFLDIKDGKLNWLTSEGEYYITDLANLKTDKVIADLNYFDKELYSNVCEYEISTFTCFNEELNQKDYMIYKYDTISDEPYAFVEIQNKREFNKIIQNKTNRFINYKGFTTKTD